MCDNVFMGKGLRGGGGGEGRRKVSSRCMLREVARVCGYLLISCEVLFSREDRRLCTIPPFCEPVEFRVYVECRQRVLVCLKAEVAACFCV